MAEFISNAVATQLEDNGGALETLLGPKLSKYFGAGGGFGITAAMDPEPFLRQPPGQAVSLVERRGPEGEETGTYFGTVSRNH